MFYILGIVSTYIVNKLYNILVLRSTEILHNTQRYFGTNNHNIISIRNGNDSKHMFGLAVKHNYL